MSLQQYGGYGWQQQDAARQPAIPGLIRPGTQVAPPMRQTAADIAEQAYAADETVIYAFHGSIEAKKNPMIGTLVGEYRQEGQNHGRNYYRKTQAVGGTHEVYLYYWDERDGSALNGWWFGNMVGGREVWGRNPESSPTPPPGGWNIPWDNKEEADFVVSDSAAKRAHDQRMAQEEANQHMREQQGQARQAQLTQFSSRLGPTRERVAAAEEAVKTAIANAREAMATSCPSDSLVHFQEELVRQRGDVTNVQRLVMQEGNMIGRSAPELKSDMVALAASIRQLNANIHDVLGELENYRKRKITEEWANKQKEAEQVRLQQQEAEFETKLAETSEATLSAITDAEDEVEKVSIAATPLETDTGDELEAVLLDAVSETEQRYKVAMLAIVEAKKAFNSGKAMAIRMPTPKLKQDAAEEFTKLNAKLNALHARVDQYKTVRKDYQQRAQEMATINDFSGKIVGAEVSLEQAAATSMNSQEDVKEVEKAASSAQAVISQTTKSIAAKWPAALVDDESKNSPALRHVRELKERIGQVQETAHKMMQEAKAARLKMITETLLSDVSEKMQAAEDSLEEMSGSGEALMDDFPEDPAERKARYAQADTIMAKVHSALGDAQAYLARKLAEAVRLTPGSANDVKEEIGKLQTRLKDGRSRLDDYKNSLAEHRRRIVFEEVEATADSAGAQIDRLSEAATAAKQSLSDGESSIERFKELSEEVAMAEKEARIGVATALRVLSQKTNELKKISSRSAATGADLGKIHTRLSGMQEEISKLGSSVKEARERAQAKESLTELASHVEGAEAEVQKISETAAPLIESVIKEEKAEKAEKDEEDENAVPMEEDGKDDEGGHGLEPNAKALQEFDSGSASAQQKLNTTAKLVDLKLRTATGFLREELEDMRTKLSDAEDQLVSLSSKVQEVRERKQVVELLGSVSQIVSNAEAKIQSALEAETPLSEGIEKVDAEQLRVVLTACEELSPEAGQAIADAQAALAGTLLEAQNLSEGSAKKCRQELKSMQERVERISSSLSDFRTNLASRKRAGRGQLLVAVVAAAESCTQKLGIIIGKFDSDETDPAEKPLLCQEMPEADVAAQKAMADARQFIAAQLTEVRSLMGEERKQLTIDLSAKQTKLTQVQAELTKFSRQAGAHEARFQADQLLEDATAGLQTLQGEMEAASKVAAPLLAADRSDLLQEVRLHSLLQALQDCVKSFGSVELLFAKIAKSGGSSASLTEFVDFLETLPDVTGKEDLVFSEEQARGFLSARGSEEGTISQEQLEACLAEHYICSGSGPLVAGAGDTQQVGTLERGEVLQTVAQEQQGGATFMQCILGRDASTAWVLFEKGGQNGSENGSAVSSRAPTLEPRSSDAWQLESIEAFVSGLWERCAQAAESIDQRMDKVMNAKDGGGPLAAVKAKLLNLRMKVSAERSKMEQLGKRVATAKAAVLQQRQEELKVLQEARKKTLAMKSVQEACKVLEIAETKVPLVADVIKSRSADTLQKELSGSELDQLKERADDALQGFSDTKNMVDKAMKAQEDRKMLLEVRLELTKLNSRVTTAERRCRQLVEPVLVAHQRVVGAATAEAQSKLRLAARRSKKSSDELFDQFAKGAKLVEKQFSSLVGKLPENKLSSQEIGLLFRDFRPEGLSRLDLAGLMQEFMVCELATTMTRAFDVSKTETLRKVELGELFQVVDGPKLDANTEVSRAQVHALLDGAIGWVSVTGNKGKTFLRSVEKPVLVCQEEVAMSRDFEDGSPMVRMLEVEEVVELLEGPKEEILVGEIHVQGTCVKDGAAGWITLQDSKGVEYASATVGSYKCKAVTALTDGPDVKKCKVIRRVEVGEVLEVCGDEKEPPAAEGAVRLRFKMARDNKEGWVTIRGTRGTAFLEAQSEYSIKKSVLLRASVEPDSEALSQLEPGEAFKASGIPKTDQPGRRIGVRVRSAGEDRSEGWVLQTGPQAEGGTPPLQPQGEPLLGW